MRLVPVVVAAVVLSGCSSSSTVSSATASPSASPTPTLAPTPSPSPTPHNLATCPPAQSESALPVFARPGGAPDDLSALPDGGVWVTDQPNNRITRLDANGGVVMRFTDPRGPEGILAQADGTLILAEQGLDRVVVLRPPSAMPVSVLVQLQPVAGRPGLDSVEVDRAGGRLLIPDSPRGAILSIPLGGGALSTLATGLGRPVDAVAAPDGPIYAVAENAPGLTKIPGSGGAATRVSSLNDLDDVLALGSLLYVTDLGDGSVRAVDPSSGETRTLVTGIGQPQGLTQLADGRMLVSDSGRNLIVVFAAC